MELELPWLWNPLYQILDLPLILYFDFPTLFPASTLQAKFRILNFPHKGPTLKLMRHVVVKKYAAQIDAMYEVTNEEAKP